MRDYHQELRDLQAQAQRRGQLEAQAAELEKIRPTTLAQASRIDGVTVSEIALLQIHLSRLQKESSAE